MGMAAGSPRTHGEGEGQEMKAAAGADARREAAERESFAEWERAERWRYAGPHLELARDAASARAKLAGALAVHGRDASALAKAAKSAERLQAAFEAWKLELLAVACPNPCAVDAAKLARFAERAAASAWKVVEAFRAGGADAAADALQAERAALFRGDVEGAGDAG